MLRQKGIDLDHNRFLILQGEVEQISMMKPKADNSNDEGMLEYLEDIIGSSRLKPLIEMLNQDWDSKILGSVKNKFCRVIFGRCNFWMFFVNLKNLGFFHKK